ncbi:hypothetical protein MMC07_001554 [Pseudocyphellaria aurata]|nr:hypothetical protein [Pseudocyphellaria aurata]
MFYSHEILTSREGGVATVWLVATLGSKSNLKRVNRRAILDVDVPRTCQIIIKPEVPMALRLQSNLLYGVSRVYSQQCGYILSDAQIAHSNMRTLIKTMRTAELDPNAGKARRDQLILQDDPAFLPDLLLPGFDIDLSALDVSTDESSRHSSVLSRHSQRSSQSSNKDGDESVLGLVIPSSDTGGGGEIGGYMVSNDDPGSIERRTEVGGFLDDEDGFNLDPGFTVDEDGNLIITEDQRTSGTQAVTRTPFMRIGSDSAASGLFREAMDLNLDLGLPRIDDGNVELPNAEAFPEMVAQVPTTGKLLRSSSAELEEDSSSTSVDAPLRRKRRAPKALPYDSVPELRNADLTHWNDNYVRNMAHDIHIKMEHRAPKVSKQNAAFWVGGSGVGGVGSATRSSGLNNPLDMFAGDTLIEALTGVVASVAGRKRTRDEEGDRVPSSEERRVRMRDGGDDQLGRTNELAMNEGETLAVPGEDDIEIGREAQASLEDQSFPWNLTASAAVSRLGSVARGLDIPSSAGFTASGRGASSVMAGGSGQPGSLDRRASRITSASPLLGRGLERYSSLELPAHEDDDELLGGRDLLSSRATDNFELYGPAAGVSTQTAAESQWMRATLDHESKNFLEFLKADIERKMPSVTGEDLESTSMRVSRQSVVFEDLLPPSQHTKVVAAQALHHVLALATKGLISVQQDEDYGPVILRLPVEV